MTTDITRTVKIDGDLDVIVDSRDDSLAWLNEALLNGEGMLVINGFSFRVVVTALDTEYYEGD